MGPGRLDVGCPKQEKQKNIMLTIMDKDDKNVIHGTHHTGHEVIRWLPY